jgi:hypothetical protein
MKLTSSCVGHVGNSDESVEEGWPLGEEVGSPTTRGKRKEGGQTQLREGGLETTARIVGLNPIHKIYHPLYP